MVNPYSRGGWWGSLLGKAEVYEDTIMIDFPNPLLKTALNYTSTAPQHLKTPPMFVLECFDHCLPTTTSTCQPATTTTTTMPKLQSRDYKMRGMGGASIHSPTR